MIKRLALGILCVAAVASGQPAVRRATNVAALLSHPGFYHARQILVVGEVLTRDTGETRVEGESGAVRLVFKGSAPDGVHEVRGEFWDLGRLNAADPRLSTYDLKSTFGIDPEGAWPRPGQVTAIIATAVSPASTPSAPSVRNLVLYPSRYLDQRVTVTGQFGGRNLLGDLADAPAQGRYDFVLRSADAAIWVTNLRPRGKDFELALDARIDTGRWLEVSGTLQQGRGLQWLDGQAGSLKLTQPPREMPSEEAAIRVPAAPPPEVVFSTPTDGETDVALTTTVRVQFSRDISPLTFKNHIIVKYGNPAAPTGQPDSPIADFTTQYLPGTRVLEIKFARPLERFRTIQVEMGETVVGTDQQPLKPWTLTFQTGGS